MATEKQEEKRGDGGGRKQEALVRQGEQKLATTTPTAREITRASPVTRMRRVLDDLEASLFGWTPGSMMRRMIDDMERFFESDFFADMWRAPEYEWAPRVDVRHRDDSLVIAVDLPGISQDQVELSTEDNRLVIEGERPRPTEQGELWQSERAYGRFRRVVTLPEGIDAEKVTARFENGVLEIALPLPPSQVPRRIPIGTTAAPEELPAAAQQQAPQPQPPPQAEVH